MLLKKSLGSCLISLLLAGGALAGETVDLGTIIVTGSLAPMEESKLGKSINVSKVESVGKNSVHENIDYLPGVNVKRAGGVSGITSVRLRGSRSIDTKLLYNGHPVRDPSSPQGSSTAFWGDFSSSGVDRVEVVKGPQSSIYGSEAIGGVVNVIPKRDGSFIGSYEYGSHSSSSTELSAYGFGASYKTSDGFDGNDDYNRISLNGHHVFSQLVIDWLYSETDAMLNDSPVISGGQFHEDVDDPNDTREYRHYLIGIYHDADITDKVSLGTQISLNRIDRRFTFLPDAPFDFMGDIRFEGTDFQWQERLYWLHNDTFHTILGYEYGREWMTQEDITNGLTETIDQYHNDVFIEEIISYGPVDITLAGRYNTHETATGRITYEGAVSYVPHNSVKIHSHYGTAFREPSLFELDGAFLSSFGRFEIGNKELSPERAKGFDIGVDVLVRGGILSATYFRNDITNRIDFIGAGYVNVDGQLHTDGVELGVEYGDWTLSYTHTNGTNLIDVPADEASIIYETTLGGFKVRASGSYVGDRVISVFNLDTFTVDPVDEGGHITLDLYAGYNIRENMEVYVRADNVLGEDYRVGGFRTPGTTVYGGVKWEI